MYDFLKNGDLQKDAATSIVTMHTKIILDNGYIF